MQQLDDRQQVSPLKPTQSQGGASELQAVIKSLVGKIHTNQLVEVVSVYDSDEIAPVGFVDIKQLVPMIDGSNNVYDTGIIKKVPYFRLQGGANAIVINPKVGDIGLAGFCERDISMVKRNRKLSPPNTRRQYSINDAVYWGGFLNGTPSQYIQFKGNEIVIKSNSKVTIDAPNSELTGNLKVNGTTEMIGAVTTQSTINAIGNITSNGLTFNTHKHGGVQSGSSDTGSPK